MAIGCLSLVGAACGQDPLRGTMVTAFGDVADIKIKAEAGDSRAQVSLGDALDSSYHSREALDWYRKAAEQGNTEGAYHLGHLLLFGGVGIPKEQIVAPDPTEGLPWTYRAATNLFAPALNDMSQALDKGLGTSPNAVGAYAWMQLYAESAQGSIVGHVCLNQMALKLDTTSIQQGQQLANEFKHGQWQPIPEKILAPAKNPASEVVLKLNGVTSGSPALASINGRTLAVGESTKVTLTSGTVNLKCLKIEPKAVLIQIEGEETPRRLTIP